MNIVLWIVQIIVALHAAAGSVFRFFAYDTAAKGVPSVQALPYGAWIAIGVFEIACALALVLPRLLGKPEWTYRAALALAVEMTFVTLWHVRFSGFALTAENPAVWTFGLALGAAVVAWGRRGAR